MITLSDLDQERFGHVTAKVQVGERDDLGSILAECADRRVELLIARCATGHLAKVQAMERLGFFLTDTLVYYRKEQVSRSSLELPEAFRTRCAQPEDAPEMERVAGRVFHGYLGHYHADPRLDTARCDEVYSSWAANSCSGGDFCTEMILITAAATGAIAGFAALKRRDDAEFDGVLFGVDPAFQRQGLFDQLLELSQRWGIEHGFARMLYSTQLTNVPVQRTLCRRGFEPLRSTYTLHKWLA